MTNFQKVSEFNTAFGVLEKDKSLNKSEITDSSMRLIREEVRELEDAVFENNFFETVDALTDILYVVYGMGLRLGIDLDSTFEIVHNNNMSKLCSTEEIAQKTVEMYKEKGIPAAYRKVGKYYAVYNSETNKVLKSMEWKEIDWSEYL